MTMQRIIFTHRGWLGLCPVLIANTEDASPIIEPIHPAFEPLLGLSVAIFNAINWMMSAMRNDHEPFFVLRVTGQLPDRIDADGDQ